MVTHNMNNSLASLCNIGNSCYMNSVLYTLRFAPNFTHNLHHLVEFLELVLQKNSVDRQHTLQQKHGQNPPHLNQQKPKSSSLGRNIPGVHGSSGRSWSSKDLASLGGINGNETTAGGRFVGTTGNTSVSGISSFGPCDGAGSECSTANTGNGINSVGLDTSTNSRNQRDTEVNGKGGPKSKRHIVCETLHELFHNLARNEAADVIEPFHAGGLLHAVQCVSTTFEGNQQQDAHEFLMCILDSVRESCQTLNKNLLDKPDLLRHSSNAGPATTLETTDASYLVNTYSATEAKPSSAPFIARNLFRRRKESLKKTKSNLAKEGKSITVDGSAITVHSVPPNTLIDAAFGEVSINPPATKKSNVTDERLLQDRIRALGLNFFCEDFEGVTVSRTRCLSCETVTEKKETMIDIAIPITSSEGNDAAKNPQQFYQDACITQEYFRGDNKYRCEVCLGYTEACRTISFDILPRLLVLQLKRFNGDMEKINSYIPTPFVMQCFCRDCLGKPETEKRHIYRLYSVITHVGARMSVGHYIAYTSSLEIPLQHFDCINDQQKSVLLAATSLESQQSSHVDAVSNSVACGKRHNGNEKSTSGQLKKLFGGKKASSAGDISKKLKHNVISRFSSNHGIEALQLNGNSTAAPPGLPTTAAVASAAVGSNEQLGLIGGTGINLQSVNTAGSFPYNIGGIGTISDEHVGTGNSKSHDACPCPSIACCGVLTKTSATHNQQPHLHTSAVSGIGMAKNISDGGTKRNPQQLYNMSLKARNASNVNRNKHLNIHSVEVNSDSTTSLVANSQSSGAPNVPMNAAHKAKANRNVANESNQQQQRMWYMCDDDKIKIMTQLEFEEMLSPNRRHVITPYLLFYARYDVQQEKLQQSQSKPSSKAATASNVSAGIGEVLLPEQLQPI